MALNARRFDASGGNSKFVNKVNAPRLVSIGQDLTIQAASLNYGGGSSLPIDLGLPKLTSLGGGLSIHNPALPNLHMVGLSALTTVPGDLVFDWQNTDLTENTLLPALVTVGGSADITLPPIARDLFLALTTISGNVNVHAAKSYFQPEPGVLPQLKTVGGSFSLENVETNCLPIGNRFASLHTVAGAFSVIGTASQFKRAMGGTGVNHLVVGSLEMTGTHTLLIPFGPDMQVAGAGAVAFQDNANVCPCQISIFTSGLTANGWTGAVTGGNNGTAVSCTPFCPAPPTCP
jgi:hypothetical protein